MFQNAIVRKPGHNFADGLTTSQLGAPVFEKALEQHARYCAALESCGLKVTALDPDLQHPDSTFVEDTAVLTRSSAILTRLGAESRQGEVLGIREPLARFFSTLHEIRPPGTLDGGDICNVENHFFIGISHRTNEEGSRQLASFLAREGCTSSFLDVRGMKSLLHLKSGVAYLGENNLVVCEELLGHPQFRGYNHIPVGGGESYAANCLRINARVLIPARSPLLEASLKRLGYVVVPLDMFEFQKMDGGLSCLSLRF